VLASQIWAPCASTNETRTNTPGWVRMANSSQEWMRPAGWRVVSTLWVMDGPAQAGVYWPFATVLIKGSQMAFLIRGTETYDDWLTGASLLRVAHGACLHVLTQPAVLLVALRSTAAVCYSAKLWAPRGWGATSY
jgi:hypothetical protein